MSTQVKTKQILDGSLQRVDLNQDVNSGLKHIVRVATTAAGTLASSFQNGSSIDGITLATNDLILIKNQSAGAENGIYVVAVSGAPTRYSLYNTDAKIRPSSIQVKEGSSNGSKLFRCTNITTITVDTTALSFTEIGGGAGGSAYFDDDGGAPSVAPSAGGTDSIAIGEAASVGAGATNSFAIGTSAVVSASVTNSLAIGTGASAASSSGIAIGRNARVLTNAYAVAIGPGSSYSDAANASGNSSIALGRGTDASVLGSVAIGWNAQATANSYTVAIGGGSSTSLAANATGSKAIAIGYGSDSTATQSVAIGNLSQATGANTVAIGSNASASSSGAVAIRGNATGTSSICIGANNAQAIYSISIGAGSSISGGGRNIALGHSASTGSNYAIVIGSSASITGTSDASIAIGRAATSTRENTISIGRSSNNRSNGSIAIGYSAQTFHVNSTNSIAIGRSAIVGHTSFMSSGGIAIGYSAKAYSASTPSYYCVAIGFQSLAHGSGSTALGQQSKATLADSVAIGRNAYATTSASIGLGASARAEVEFTIQTQATSIIRKDSGLVGTNSFIWGAANESIIMTKEISLKTGATTTITVPTGSRFYPNEVGLILTTLGGTITLQPDVSFGITGTNNKFVTQTTSSLNALYERDAYIPLTTTGESTLTFTVNVAATGSADIKGRAYFKGILVEIQ